MGTTTNFHLEGDCKIKVKKFDTDADGPGFLSLKIKDKSSEVIIYFEGNDDFDDFLGELTSARITLAFGEKEYPPPESKK